MERGIGLLQGSDLGFDLIQMFLQGALESKRVPADKGVVMMFRADCTSRRRLAGDA